MPTLAGRGTVRSIRRTGRRSRSAGWSGRRTPVPASPARPTSGSRAKVEYLPEVGAARLAEHLHERPLRDHLTLDPAATAQVGPPLICRIVSGEALVLGVAMAGIAAVAT